MASAAKPSPAVHFDGDEADIGDTLTRISTHKGVLGIIVLTQDGVVLRSTLDDETANSYGLLIHDLIRRGRHGIRDLDPSNDLSFLRLRTKKHEIIVSLDRDYLLVVIQNPNAKDGQQESLRLRARPENADDDGEKL